MYKKEFRQITSRILRHSGFKVRMNKSIGEYELFDNSSPDPVIYCKPVLIESDTEKAEIENYLCFRVFKPLSPDQEKLYNRMINRFTRLAPSISISFENEMEPVFTDDEIGILENLVNEYDKGDNNEK